MWFVTLVKLRRAVSKEDLERVDQTIRKWMARGNKIHSALYTLGQYDQVWVWESADEKTSLASVMEVADLASTETLAAARREDVAQGMQ